MFSRFLLQRSKTLSILRSHILTHKENVKLSGVSYNHFVESRSHSFQGNGKFRVNKSSFGGIQSDFGSKDDSLKRFGPYGTAEKVNFQTNGKFIKSRNGLERRRFRRNESSSSDDESDLEDEVEGVEGWRDVKKLGSSASLGKYDVKIRRRVPQKELGKELEKEIDFSEQVELLRKELGKKKLAKIEQKKGEEETIYSQKSFDDCGISPLTVKALSAAGYFQMTRVQEATLSVCLEGKDALVKAKTGTGKTAAFLLPAIETVLKAASTNTIQRVPPVFVLILCPTRELASQLAAEANALLKYHNGIGVQTLVGGTRFKVDQKRLESEPCQVSLWFMPGNCFSTPFCHISGRFHSILLKIFLDVKHVSWLLDRPK